MKQKLIHEAVSLYKKTLNQDSKWFAHDVKEFKDRISACSVAEIRERIQRLNAYDSPAVAQQAEAYASKLASAGMFNVQKMGGRNALD